MFGKLKRRSEQKTDYNQRLGLLKSGKLRLAVRRSLSGISAQIIEYQQNGDKVLLTVRSRELKKFGWLGGNNLSSSYLTGLLTGLRAAEKGMKEAVLDMGLNVSTKGNRVYAFAKGCNDAGLNVALGSEITPAAERIEGKHIEKLATSLKEKGAYDKYFSSYIKKGLKPEEMSRHFEEVKNNILNNFSKK